MLKTALQLSVNLGFLIQKVNQNMRGSGKRRPFTTPSCLISLFDTPLKEYGETQRLALMQADS